MGNKIELSSFRIPVPAAFEDVFSHFYVAENNTDQRVTKTLLPSYQTIFVFSFGAAVSLITKNTEMDMGKCLVIGPIRKAFDYVLAPGSEILIVNFKDDAFYRFFGNISLYHHLPIDPDGLWKENCFTDLWQALKSINHQQERIDFILDFCRPYLRERNLTAELLTNFKEPAQDPVKAIAKELGQTERNIQIQHKKIFGYTAKEISRYQRFLKAVEFIQNKSSSAEKPDWFEIIAQCGYFDQSQLIHDFKHFLNLSPKQFLKFQQDVCWSKTE